MKAALASLAVADGCAIPVVCGLGTGADAPKPFVPRLCQRPTVALSAPHTCFPLSNEGNRGHNADPVSLARFCRQGHRYRRRAE